MGQNSFRAVPASRVKSEDQSLQRASSGFGFCGGNFYALIFSRQELSSRWVLYRDFARGRILAGIPEESFFLGGISASTDFSARFLPRYAAGIFPGKDAAGKMGHLGEIAAESRQVRGILPGSRRDPATYFTRVAQPIRLLETLCSALKLY